jgi:molybdenum cofactor synthesis domain-containing protein
VPASSIVVVGNEILRGFTVDTNSNWLAARLFECGFPVRRMTTVGDVDQDIVDAVRDHIGHPGLSRIFVCGGLGPTPDDRTYAALAHALERPLTYHRQVGAQMQNLMFIMNIAARRGTAALNAGNRKMAILPDGAIVLRNGAGMAPGLAIELANDRYLFALPGVPAELRAVFLDVQRRYLLGAHGDVVRELRYRAVPESAFHDVMQGLEVDFPDVSLGSYPQTESRELILRANGPRADRVDAVLNAIRARVTQYRPIDDSP